MLPAAATVLVVAGEAGSRDQVARWLRPAGHQVWCAPTPDEALSLLSQGPVAVVLCEVPASGGDNLQLVEHFRRQAPDAAIVLMTDVPDVRSAVRGLRRGVVDYLVRPFGRARLRDAVRRGLDWHDAAAAARAAGGLLHADVAAGCARVEAALGALGLALPAGLEDALRAVTLHQPALFDHARRVSRLATEIAARAGLPESGVAELARAALLHDLPKLIYPEHLAQKPGPLLPLEREIIRSGPALVRRVVERIPVLATPADVVYCRYEWWDGSGYPRGLRSRLIPLPSRILAIADTFDTLVHRRSHRPAIDHAAAVDEIVRCAGTQFDPAVVAAFLRAQARAFLPTSAA